MKNLNVFSGAALTEKLIDTMSGSINRKGKDTDVQGIDELWSVVSFSPGDSLLISGRNASLSEVIWYRLIYTKLLEDKRVCLISGVLPEVEFIARLVAFNAGVSPYSLLQATITDPEWAAVSEVVAELKETKTAISYTESYSRSDEALLTDTTCFDYLFITPCANQKILPPETQTYGKKSPVTVRYQPLLYKAQAIKKCFNKSIWCGNTSDIANSCPVKVVSAHKLIKTFSIGYVNKLPRIFY